MNKKTLLALVFLTGCSSVVPAVRAPIAARPAALVSAPRIMTAGMTLITPLCHNGASGSLICAGDPNTFMATPNGAPGRFGARQIASSDLPNGITAAIATGGVSAGPSLAGVGWLTPGQTLLTADFTLLNVGADGYLSSVTANTLAPIGGASTIVVRVRLNHGNTVFAPTTLTCTLNSANQTCTGFSRIAVSAGDQITIQGTWNAALQPGISATAYITN